MTSRHVEELPAFLRSDLTHGYTGFTVNDRCHGRPPPGAVGQSIDPLYAVSSLAGDPAARWILAVMAMGHAKGCAQKTRPRGYASVSLDGTTRMRRLRVPPCVAAKIGYADAMDQWSCYSRAGQRLRLLHARPPQP